MKNDYGLDTFKNKISISAVSLWMEIQRGEGELEIEDQGRFGIFGSRFSQETGAIDQQAPRIGEHGPMRRVLSAGCAFGSDSTPQFFFSGREADRS